jgi:hypothetical protein
MLLETFYASRCTYHFLGIEYAPKAFNGAGRAPGEMMGSDGLRLTEKSHLYVALRASNTAKSELECQLK